MSVCLLDAPTCADGPVVTVAAVCEFNLHLTEVPVCSAHDHAAVCASCWDEFGLVVTLFPTPG